MNVTVEMDPLRVPLIIRGEITYDNQVEALEQHPTVKAVYSDPVIQPCTVCPGGAMGSVADVARLLAVPALAANGMDGSGILVVIVDTGINLPYLQAKGLFPQTDSARSWKPNTALGTPFNFPVNHGTMCAYDVLIAAPKCTLLDYAALLSRRQGQTGMDGLLSDAVLAYSQLLQLLQNPTRPGEIGSLVVSNSWGMFDPASDFPPGTTGNYSDNPAHPFNRIVVTLERSGADILFAAGNCGPECPDGRCRFGNTLPICGANSSPAVLSVAGVVVTGDRIGYSSQGPGRIDRNKPDICGFTHFRGSGVYAADGGTSAACPVVAGVIAALRTRKPYQASDPGSSPAAIRNLVRKTALDRGNIGFDYAYGWGIINGAQLSRVTPGLSNNVEVSQAVQRLEAEMQQGYPMAE